MSADPQTKHSEEEGRCDQPLPSPICLEQGLHLVFPSSCHTLSHFDSRCQRPLPLQLLLWTYGRSTLARVPWCPCLTTATSTPVMRLCRICSYYVLLLLLLLLLLRKQQHKAVRKHTRTPTKHLPFQIYYFFAVSCWRLIVQQ